MKTFRGKGGLILVLILAITNSAPAFEAQGTTTAADGSPRYTKTVDVNGNWVWSWTTENGEARSVTVSPGSYPGTGAKSGADDLGFEFPGRGFAYEACPSLDGNNNKKSDEKIKDDIYEVTKLHITAQTGTLYLEDEAKWIEDQKLVAAEKTTLPETKKTELPYSQNWSGIRNFLFPNTYYAEGSFSTSAAGAHRVKIYAADGAYAATIDAVQRDGKYVTDISVEGNDYYAVIFNGIEGSASNAAYTVK
ncbi:hypothetical protein LK536_07560 [Lachnoclostridium pacaense]|uniref:hypothetical protein n=1 Tax=Enterocloster hominis (ex Hitch et al. 2024) TaxID=1917870 RepID=UPI001D10E9E7|nr:hypothetical protein [Lachnoclostridium pacaense]MCC2876132.1 hypothetical protein [Lachnoclostridium pacaense]